MRACIVTPEFPLVGSRGRGGVGTYSETLAKALASRGVEVHVAIYGDREVSTLLKSSLPVRVHYVPLKWVRYFSEFFPGLWQSVRLWRFLSQLDREFHFDVFEMYNDEGVTLFPLLFFGGRTVFRMHTSIRQHIVHKGEPFNRRRNFTVWLDRLAARSAVHLVTHSVFHAAEMADEYGLAPVRFQVIPHCTPEVRRVAGAEASLVVGYIGSLDRRKGVDVILDAAPAILRAVPDARILIVGRDTGFSKEKTWARWFAETAGADARVEFTGSVGDLELKAQWERIGILVVPSRYESFGLAVIEGFARGKAVVTTTAAALTETAREGAVFTEAGNSADLAEAVIRLLKDPALAAQVAERGYQTYRECYTMEVFADRVMQLYGSVTG